MLAGDGSDADAWDEDADEVEGVGGGDGDFMLAVAGARGAEGFDRFWEGKLLSAEARDETSATDFAAGLKTAEDVEEIAPLGSVRFTLQEITEEDAVAAEEHGGGGFKRRVKLTSLGDGGGLALCGRGPGKRSFRGLEVFTE